MATHRRRLAKDIHAATGLPYQKALAFVTAQSEAGRLPRQLDTVGMRQALEQLLGTLQGPSLGDHPGRYLTVVEINGRPLGQYVTGRLDNARAHAPAPASDWPGKEDFAHLGAWYEEKEDRVCPAWLAQVINAGPRIGHELPCPYTGQPDEVPLDLALDRRDVTGDIIGYEADLNHIVKDRPDDIDTWAHLGNLTLAFANGGDDYFRLPAAPSQAERHAGLHTALRYYQTAVAVAELSLPDPFTGSLPWGCLYNRPFFRALHGLALTWWQLECFAQAQHVLVNMLWLNPTDNLGMRDLLPKIADREPWTGDA